MNYAISLSLLWLFSYMSIYRERIVVGLSLIMQSLFIMADLIASASQPVLVSHI